MTGRQLRSGIPIPSFCVSPTPEAAGADVVDSPPAAAATNSSMTPTWNKSWLLRTEGALHVQRVRRGSNSKFTSDGRMGLDDFYALARHLALVETTTTTTTAAGSPHNMTLPEQLLLDLVCAASPSLYQLVQDDQTTKWCLQMVTYHGNRMEELRRLLCRSSIEVETRDSTLEVILNHKTSQSSKLELFRHQSDDSSKEKMETPPSSMKQKAIIDPYIKPDMTLEERVRARADARQERQSVTTSQSEQDGPDLSSLLRLADAMWSHSRRIHRRQAQLLLQAPRISSQRICMTLSDVVRLFAGSLGPSPSSCGARTEQVAREVAPKKQVFRALRQVQTLAPEWISFSSEDLSKHTTVWFAHTVDYAIIRNKLGAPPSSKKRSIEESTLLSAAGSVPRQDKESTLLAARVLVSPIVPAASKKILTTPQDASLSSTPTKKQRVASTPTIKNAAACLKRSAQETLESPKPKKKKGLRINRHLILTDADYDGGMILQPSIDESPRGLKRLFTQMNSGQRI